MGILFDTHTLIWFLTDSPRLSEGVRRMLRNFAGNLFYSSVSILEISIQHSLKPEAMPCVPEEVAADAEVSGIRELPFLSRHAKVVGDIPWIHRDPFDRMLVAQAVNDGLKLLSHDDLVIRYGDFVIPC